MIIFFLFILIHFCNMSILTNCPKTGDSLFDVIHLFIPKELVYFGFVSDILTIFILLFTLVHMCHCGKLFLFSKSLLTNMTLKLFISMLTIMPDPSGICDIKPFAFVMGRCNDLVVSGHASNSLLCYYFYHQYCNQNLSFERKRKLDNLFWYFILCNCIWIIISRNHYTTDVIFSFFVSRFVFEQRENIYAY